MQDCGRFIMEEAPEVFMAELLPFLEAERRAPAKRIGTALASPDGRLPQARAGMRAGQPTQSRQHPSCARPTPGCRTGHGSVLDASGGWRRRR
ncbi:hypothetical protein CBM2633_B60178 [Cupriavidus taiwanensis]|nr:hypothetical protein CBM2633_B60178 [Cupriavidus taiwanensis]